MSIHSEGVTEEPVSGNEFFQKLLIRANHPYAYRHGQWAAVTGVAYKPERLGNKPAPARVVYLVKFVDGQTDQWPVYDPDAAYEFSAGVKP